MDGLMPLNSNLLHTPEWAVDARSIRRKKSDIGFTEMTVSSIK